MRIIGGLIVSAALTTSAVAEPMTFQNGLTRVEGVVGRGVSIPIGGDRKKYPPRVELRLTRDVVNFDSTRQSPNSSIRPTETRIGFSLERSRRFLLNGQPIDRAQRNNVSTVGWIAIGAGVVLIGGFLHGADAVRDSSD